jgi:DUF4097 and DUF4098 domain-containing protein YvlB
MKSIIIAVCSLCIVILVSGCDKFNEDVKSGVKKIANAVGTIDSISTVNGVLLKYPGVQNLKAAFADNSFTMDESTADIILTGNTAKEADLKVSYQEYSKGDATVYLDKTTLKIKTKSGKPALITRIEGNIPRQLKLALSTSSGDISVSNLQDNPEVSLACSSGDIALAGCNSQSVKVQVASGDINVSKCNISDLVCETASGDISVSDSSIKTMKGETASGDINLRNSKIAERHFSIASGSVNEE